VTDLLKQQPITPKVDQAGNDNTDIAALQNGVQNFPGSWGKER